MILIGMFDSPFVRRVAVSMKLLGMKFEHRNWSVGKDLDLIRQYNPLGQVPTLVLDSGEVLCESGAILDYLDSIVGPARALIPPDGVARRDALQFMALAIGAAEKGRTMIYERAFRPEDKRHEPWVERCRTQMVAGLAELNRRCDHRRQTAWLFGERPMQPDITLTSVFTFLYESGVLGSQLDTYSDLRDRTARGESLPEFRTSYVGWAAPQGQ